MLSVIQFALVAVTASQPHAGLPYTPPTVPFDNALARVQLSTAIPDAVTQPHVHLTNRVMIYFQAGTNTIRYQNGKVSPEVFRSGDVQWNNAMGTHTATVTASSPVDIVHVELKSSPNMAPGIEYSTSDRRTVDHFKIEIDNNQVRVARFHLRKGEKSLLHGEAFERLLVPLTAARLKATDAKGNVKAVTYRQGEVQWLMPGTEADENTGDEPYDAIIVEFKK